MYIKIIGSYNHYETWLIDRKTCFEYFGKKVHKVLIDKKPIDIWTKMVKYVMAIITGVLSRIVL